MVYMQRVGSTVGHIGRTYKKIVFEISETRAVGLTPYISVDIMEIHEPYAFLSEITYPVLVNTTSLWTFSAFSRSSRSTFTFSLIIPIASSPTARRIGSWSVPLAKS